LNGKKPSIPLIDTGAAFKPNDLAETSEVGDWKMPDFKAACSYAAS
jgi:hypothetical protein